MKEPKRDFKGVWIPKHIWLNADLTIMERLFLAEIDSLDNSANCFASNAHFSYLFGLSKNRCTEIIKQLESKKMVMIKHKRKGVKVVERTIQVTNVAVLGNRKSDQGSADLPRETDRGCSEKREGSNTLLNNTNNLNDLINQILESWRKYLPNNPQPIVKNFTDSSKYKTLITRIKSDEQHQAIDFWNWYFSKLAENPFNLGQNERGWKANFDYAITKSKFENNIERFTSE